VERNAARRGRPRANLVPFATPVGSLFADGERTAIEVAIPSNGRACSRVDGEEITIRSRPGTHRPIVQRAAREHRYRL